MILLLTEKEYTIICHPDCLVIQLELFHSAQLCEEEDGQE